MLSGKRAVDDNRSQRERNLVSWLKPYLTSKRKVLQVFDSRIEGQYSFSAALKAAYLASRCLAVEPKLRPNMNEVVRMLEQLQDPEDNGHSQNSGNGTCIEKAASCHSPPNSGNETRIEKAVSYKKKNMLPNSQHEIASCSKHQQQQALNTLYIETTMTKVN
jgi:hypothetical protein